MGKQELLRSPRMKILLLGKNGQVGWELQRSLGPLGELIALDRQSEICGDISKLEKIADTIRTLSPDVIVNAAAYTAVDKAEHETDMARTLNTDAPAALAKAALEIGAWLVHYSTDYVFDGTGTWAWKEDDTPNPLSVYGRTKLEGEEAIISLGGKHLIFRTSWVHSVRGQNFTKTILRLAQEQEELKIIDDQCGAPTGADLIADITAHVVRVAVREPHLSGIYHLSAAGETSWHGYAHYVILRAKEFRPELDLKTISITPVSTSTFSLVAKRPHNSRLDTQKLQQTFDLTLPHWKSGVDRLLNEIL